MKKGKKKTQIIVKEKKQVQSREGVFALFDKYDDEQILKQLQGETLKTYVYQFVDKEGRTITGISKVGVDMACREMAKANEIIREIDLTMIDDGEYANFIAKCGRFMVDKKSGKEILLDTKIAQKRQWKNLKARTGVIIPNKFWFEQGGQKALRNGRRDLINANLIAKLIGKWIQTGNVMQVSEKEQGPEQPNENVKYEKKPDKQTDKIKLPEITPQSICSIGKYSKIPIKWTSINLSELLYMRSNSVNPEALDKLIEAKIDKLIKDYMKVLPDFGYNAMRDFVRKKYKKASEVELSIEQGIDLIRELKRIHNISKGGDE